MKQRLIVVTGVTRGLGAALVKGFIDQGHAVIGCGRTAKRIEALRKRHDDPHLFEVLNVAEPKAVEAFAERVETSHGPPDLLINNAATINRSAPLWELSAEEFNSLMDINVNGTVNMIRAFLPLMLKTKRGVIVNISSGWGRSTSPEVAPYCASKWAIEGLSRALAQELPRGLACVPLNPGIIHTEMLESCFGGSASGYESPEEWAERAVPFILGLSSRDNGKALSVD